jgi:uncharacterized protein (DUF433 family)
MSGQPEIHERGGEESLGHSPGVDVPISNGLSAQVPRLVHRDGIAYVEGCDVPVWRLEMARRVGSPPAALLKVFPALTPEGLNVAFAYAQQHREEIDAPIQELGLDNVPSEDEEDDEAEFRADLDELFERDAELFRRLAQ